MNDTVTIWEYLKGFRHLSLGIRSESLEQNSFFKEFQDWQLGELSDTPVHPLFQAWNAYSQGNYQLAAQQAFKEIQSPNDPYITAYASLALAKTCSDSGYFASASAYASISMSIAKKHELTELMAASAGTLGEIYLRGGHPLKALEMFQLDEDLLPSGCRLKGRVLCYKAHAYSRLHCEKAARLAYRDAEHRLGERSRYYVLAGLAINAINHHHLEPRWLTSVLDEVRMLPDHQRQQNTLPLGWIYWAKAYFCPDLAKKYLHLAALAFAQYDLLEQSFIIAWARASSISLDIPSPLLKKYQLPSEVIEKPLNTPDHFSLAFDTPLLDNLSFAETHWHPDKQPLIEQRQIFMP